MCHFQLFLALEILRPTRTTAFIYSYVSLYDGIESTNRLPKLWQVANI